MSGNVSERTVTVGNPTGRTFTAANGDGLLNASGNANVTIWPGITGDGTGFRGGSLQDGDNLRISDRQQSLVGYNARMLYNGGRGVRTVTGY